MERLRARRERERAGEIGRYRGLVGRVWKRKRESWRWREGRREREEKREGQKERERQR